MRDFLRELRGALRRFVRNPEISVLPLILVGLGIFAAIFRSNEVGSLLWQEIQAPSIKSMFLVASIVVGSVATLMLRYLRADLDRPANRLSKFELIDVARRVRNLEKAASGLSAETRDALIADIRGEAATRLTSEVQERLSNLFGPAIETLARASHVKARSERTVARLETEIRALMRRGNLNLVLGTITTVSAACVLAYIALTAALAGDSWRGMLPMYLVRLSLVVFIEVFAFFFLRLYRASLHDIKYFQNEITNVETKSLALEFAVLSADTQGANKVIEELARTERNFVLKKDETTLEIERARLESRQVQELLATVKDVLPWHKGK